MRIVQHALPDDSLFNSFRGGRHPERWVGQGDCFSVTVNQAVPLSEFVVGFYSSPVFRVERLLLGVLAGAKSSDSDVQSVADGSGSTFAIWSVGERTATQLLMCDCYERTRSWFQVVPLAVDRTELRFGSAVASRRNRKTGGVSISRWAYWLMGFHVLYSRLLLRAAGNRVLRRQP